MLWCRTTPPLLVDVGKLQEIRLRGTRAYDRFPVRSLNVAVTVPDFKGSFGLVAIIPEVDRVRNTVQ